MSALGVGLVGAGRMGTVHAEHLCHAIGDARLVAVSDPDALAARRCADACGARVVEAEALLALPDVEALVIASTTDSHADLVGAGARAGKALFCEKPIALEPSQLEAALGAVAQAGVPLQVGFNRRFDPEFARARRALEEGALGTLHSLRLTSRDVAPPPLDYVRRSGGLFLDMTIHDFDMVRFLSGGEVRRLQAFGAARIDPAIGQAGDVDTALVLLEFESGALGAIDNSRQAVYGYDQRAELFGSQGVVRVGEDACGPGLTGAPASPPTRQAQLDRYLASYRLEMEDFVCCVREQREPRVGGSDALAALRLAHAARRSLAEGAPVEP